MGFVDPFKAFCWLSGSISHLSRLLPLFGHLVLEEDRLLLAGNGHVAHWLHALHHGQLLVPGPHRLVDFRVRHRDELPVVGRWLTHRLVGVGDRLELRGVDGGVGAAGRAREGVVRHWGAVARALPLLKRVVLAGA